MQTKALILPVGARMNWERFEQSIHERFNVNAVTLDGNGNRRSTGVLLLGNGLCRLIKLDLKAKKRICDTLQQKMMKEVLALKRYVTDECLAGIFRRLLPIIREDRIEGYVSLCGRPFSTGRLIYIDYIHHTLDIEREEIESLVSTLRPIGPRKIKEMTRFIVEEAARLFRS